MVSNVALFLKNIATSPRDQGVNKRTMTQTHYDTVSSLHSFIQVIHQVSRYCIQVNKADMDHNLNLEQTPYFKFEGQWAQLKAHEMCLK